MLHEEVRHTGQYSLVGETEKTDEIAVSTNDLFKEVRISLKGINGRPGLHVNMSTMTAHTLISKIQTAIDQAK